MTVTDKGGGAVMSSSLHDSGLRHPSPSTWVCKDKSLIDVNPQKPCHHRTVGIGPALADRTTSPDMYTGPQGVPAHWGPHIFQNKYLDEWSFISIVIFSLVF